MPFSMKLLDRLSGVVKVSERKWSALCPSHPDKTPSLSITEADDRVLVHCHAGCSVEDVVRAVGPTVADLFPKHLQGGRQVIATYEYRDEAGEVLFQVCRTDPKGFYQRKPDGIGGWVNSLDGVRRVLYRYPELLAADSTREVYVPEGESDVDRLRAEGLVATCNPGGAGKWRSEYSEPLRDRLVVVLQDNDEPGRIHAADVAQKLQPVARSVRIVELPGLPLRGDVSDWLAQGHTVLELVEVAEKTNIAVIEPLSATYHMTDTGNAERFADMHRVDVRYHYSAKKWLVFDGTRWREDLDGAVYRLAKATTGKLFLEAGEATDSGERRELSRWAYVSESAPRVRAMIDLAGTEHGIPIAAHELDSDPWVLNVRNGTIDLRTGMLRPHSRDDLITAVATVDYDPVATAPQWEAFLERVLQGNEDLTSYVQRAIGYTLTGDTSEQVLFFLFGSGANGKTTFLEVIRELLGDYAKSTPFASFLESNSSGPRNDLARLEGARFVSAHETAAGKRLAEDVVKLVTGGDIVTARKLYQEFEEYRPQFKVFLAANHRPQVTGTDHAIWRRIHMVPFTVRIPEREQDRHLGEKLRQELPGVLNWALEGLREWRATGLEPPANILSATQQYREQMDTLGGFIAERCTILGSAVSSSSALFESYKQWSELSGEPFLGRRQFGMSLGERGFEKRKIRGRMYYVGIALLEEEVEDEDRVSP